METGPVTAAGSRLAGDRAEQLVIALALRVARACASTAPMALGDEVVPGYGAGRRVAVDDVDFARSVVDVPSPTAIVAAPRSAVASSFVDELEVLGYAAVGPGDPADPRRQPDQRLESGRGIAMAPATRTMARARGPPRT